MKPANLRKLAEIEEKKAGQFRSLANWSALLHWKQTESNAFAKLEQYHLAAAHIYRIEAAEEIKESDSILRQFMSGVVVTILLFALIAAVPVIAQDDLATNTPGVVQVTATINGVPVEATLEPTPEVPPVVVVQQPPSDNSIYAVGFVILTVLAAIFTYLQSRQISALTGALSTVLENKQVIDEGHRLYMESSLSVQNTITLFQGVAAFLGNTIPGEDLAEKIAKYIEEAKKQPPANDSTVEFRAGGHRMFTTINEQPGQDG